MDNVHPNISILQQFNPNDINGSLHVIAGDAVFHYFNTNLPQFEGDYVGPQGFQTFFESIGKATKGTFKVNPISATPIGDELVVVHSKNSLVLEENQIEIDVVVVWRIVDGKIAEVWDIPSVHTATMLEVPVKTQP